MIPPFELLKYIYSGDLNNRHPKHMALQYIHRSKPIYGFITSEDKTFFIYGDKEWDISQRPMENIMFYLNIENRNLRLCHNKVLPPMITHVLLSQDVHKFDIEKGWHDLVEKFLIANKNEIIKFDQIKTKSGNLCIYVSKHTPEINEKIIEVQKEASQTCELCGSREDVKHRRPRFWVWNCCPSCYKNKCIELNVEIKDSMLSVGLE